MRLCLTPSPSTAPTDNGIGRIIHAMDKYLPAFGVQLTEDTTTADVVAFHAGTALGKRVDVLHCHGLYWSDLIHKEFTRTHNTANQRIVDAARRAKIITVPSQWVAEPFKRDMRISPEVIGHGIEFDEWIPDTDNGYLLWNKGRSSDVCDPTPAWKLAERGIRVVSTFGPNNRVISALSVTGSLPYQRMKQIIQNAKIYLATTPETFGIGTIEAMACGVPVLGYDWCGTKDIVKHGETGWLAPVGDVDGLVEGYYWLVANREKVGAAAREEARKYDWPNIMQKYYEIYKRVMTNPDPTGVSVVISNHNYGKYVNDAIKSCLWQSRLPDEIIVVDDGSTDNSRELLRAYAAMGKIILIEQENKGVAAARNKGIQAAKYPFIVNLDADDMMGPDMIRTLLPAMESDRGLGVAYTGVKFLSEDGRDTGHSAHREFTWEIQAKDEVPPPTCVPSCSMFRKAMWERCGGYKQKYAPGEDTEFWTHGLSLGFTAEMVTRENMFWYRGHLGSASRTGRYVSIGDNKPWLKDKIYPIGAPSYYVPEVRSYLFPLVSVIIPVGPGHEQIVEDAIESVIGQNMREWELILINDTGTNDLAWTQNRYPFIRQIMTGGLEGAGAARNLGIEKARGNLLLFLDADDWLVPNALDKMLQEYTNTGHYVFTDFYAVKSQLEITREKVFEYDREMYQKRQVIHSVTALVPTSWARDVRGFDPSLVGWEEYDFYMKLAVKGYCGTCIHEPLFYYRVHTGTRRKISEKNKVDLNRTFAKRFGEAVMPGCCGNGGGAILEAKRALGLIPRETINVPDLPNEVRMEFTGPFLGPVGYTVNGRTYYGARDEIHRFINVPKEDVEKLLLTMKWRVVPPPDGAQAERPAPEQRDTPNPSPLTNFRRG